jgi:hypothetical protein
LNTSKLHNVFRASHSPYHPRKKKTSTEILIKQWCCSSWQMREFVKYPWLETRNSMTSCHYKETWELSLVFAISLSLAVCDVCFFLVIIPGLNFTVIGYTHNLANTNIFTLQTVHEHPFKWLNGLDFCCFAFKMVLETDNQRHKMEKWFFYRWKGKQHVSVNAFMSLTLWKTIWLLEVAMGSMQYFCGITFYFLVYLLKVIL